MLCVSGFISCPVIWFIEYYFISSCLVTTDSSVQSGVLTAVLFVSISTGLYEVRTRIVMSQGMGRGVVIVVLL